ncbi:MAG: hypothetical protein K0Q68_2345 [Moraxellaceae bacterium]|jgi:hypothetical protein|nr:hypothetical protein [Moraxellaceae bacterium]
MSSLRSKSSHVLSSGKSAAESARLDDYQSVGNWVTLLMLLITRNMGIAHRCALRSSNKALKERDDFLRKPLTILAAWGGIVVLGFAVREHSNLVLGLLLCLVPLLAATHTSISRSAAATTKALRAKHRSPTWMPWIPLLESAPTVILPIPLPPPRATA